MKNVTLFAAIVITILSSCQKDKSVDLPPGSANRVKTYTEDITSSSVGHSVTTYNLSYDANNRVISVISTPSPVLSFLMTYHTGSNYSLDIYNSGLLGIHEDLFYNAASYLDSTFQYNNTQDTTTEKYFYNANNQWTKTNEYDYSKITGAVLTNSITYTYDADGNMIKSTGTDTNNDMYEYYPDLVYVYPTIGNSDAVSSKKHHLIKTHAATSNGYSLGSATFTYTFDSSDRISTEKAVADDGSVVIKTYTYF